MPTTSYKLGRDAVSTLPGVTNDDIIGVTINVTASEQDITTFKSTPLTQWEYMAGMVEITIEVSCTDFSGAVGDSGSCNVAGLGAGGDLDACVLEVKQSITPKGRVEFSVSYGLQSPSE